MSDEQTFLNEDGVLITNRRFVTGSTTYQLRGVTSVRTRHGGSPKVAGALFLVLGVLCLVVSARGGGSRAALCAIVSLVFGAGGLLASPTSELFVTTSASELRAMRGRRDRIERVADALNRAMASG